MSKKILGALIVVVVSLVIIAAVAICLYMYWPAIKGTVDGSKYYTQEDLQNSYDKGYSDGNKSEKELTEEYEYYKALVDEYYLQIDTLTKEVTELQKLVDKLQSENQNNGDLVNNLNKQVEKLNKTISELRKSIEYYEDFVAGLEQDTKVVATFEFCGSVYDIQIVYKGSTLSIVPPTNTDYVVFNCWKVNGEIIDLSTYVIEKNTKFIADVTYKFKVDFQVDGTIIKSQFVNENGSFEQIENPTKEGYMFDCWTIDGENAVDLNNYTITENVTFIAKFKRLFKVEFMVNNNVYNSQSVVEGGYIENVDNPNSEDFYGWTLNGKDIVSNIYSTPVFSDIRYIAKMKTYALLDSGVRFNRTLGLEGCENVGKIIFDKYSNSNKEYFVSGVNVIKNIKSFDLTLSGSTGTVELYVTPTVAYILSDSIILFNENCNQMFSSLRFKDIVFSNIDTSNVKNMDSMFSNCTGMESLDLSNFNTSNVETMSLMFYGCSKLRTLDISSFNTKKLVFANAMFAFSAIKFIYVSNSWNVTNLKESSEMFADCFALPNFSSSYIDKTKAHTGNDGYLILKE